MKAMFAVIALSAATFAQEPNPRYGFLWRLRQLEARWRDDVPPQERGAALDLVVQAQTQYAAGHISECCKSLDDSGHSHKPHRNDSFAIVPRRRLCDRNERELPLLLKLEYEADAWTFGLEARFECDENNSAAGKIDVWTTDSPLQWKLTWDSERLGDRALTLQLVNDDGDSSTMRHVTLSVVERRDARLAALKAGIEKLSDKAPALERETAKWTLALLERLARGSTEAHEYPAAQLLDETERVVAAAAKGERWFSMQDVGEHWLVLPLDGADVLTRVLVPDGLTKDNGAPLVLAFHGAAFDEDVWFDGYGAGAAVAECRKRGWLFAAVHSEGEDAPQRVDAILAALSQTYPVDAKHIFLLGHSRGARTALRAYAANPAHFCGVAAIGNALDDASAKSLANHPLFLAAGDHDFARDAVTAMNKTLSDAGSKTTKLTIYPNVEHWLCVQAALPDAFAWFDTLAK